MLALVGTSGINWIAPLSIAELRAVATAIVGTSSWLAQLVFLAVIVAALTVVIGDLRAGRHTGPGRWLSLSAAWLLLPVAATIALSVVEPVLVARYLIVSLPGFALVLAIGIAALARGRPALLVVGVAALVALSGPAYRSVWVRDGVDENWRSIADTVATQLHPGDAIIVVPTTAEPAFGYYAEQTNLETRRGPTWPVIAWSSPFDGHANTAAPSPALVAHLHSRQVWLVVREPGGPTVRASVQHSAPLAALQRALADRYRQEVQLVPDHGRATAMLLLYSDPRG